MLTGYIYNYVPKSVLQIIAPNSIYHPIDLLTRDSQNIHTKDEFSKTRTVFPKDARPAITPLPEVLFNPDNDAVKLHKAFKGSRTDEESIIRILTKRSLHQRLEIAEAYRIIFGYVLSYQLGLETSGEFRKLLVALVTPLPLLYANELRDTIKGPGTNEKVLIEIICSLTNYEIKAVKKAYKTVFKTYLEDDVRDDTSGQFQVLLLTLLKGNRSEELVVDPLQVKRNARRLIFTNDNIKKYTIEFFKIFTSNSFPQLVAIFHEFKNIIGHDIEEYITTKFFGDVKNTLLTIVEIARYGYSIFFARRLHSTMNGFGTNDKKLIRIMVTRSEIDLHNIAVVFLNFYRKKLAAWIQDECSGYYSLCLLCLLGSKDGKFRFIHF